MKEASKVLYLIGKILNIVVLVFVIILAALFNLSTKSTEVPANFEINDHIPTLEEYHEVMMVLFILMIVVAVILFIVLICAIFASRALKNETTNLAPHIVMIIIGVISGTIFYLFGGIFGLVAEQTQNK